MINCRNQRDKPGEYRILGIPAIYDRVCQQALLNRLEPYLRADIRDAFVSIMQTRPYPTFGRPVRLRGGPHRLRPGTSPHALQIPSCANALDGHPALRSTRETSGQRGITPAFGYGAPHSSARGTLNLLNNVLLSTHYRVVRLLQHPSVLPPVDPWLHVPLDPFPEAVLLV